jgi:hypothetical protein
LSGIRIRKSPYSFEYGDFFWLTGSETDRGLTDSVMAWAKKVTLSGAILGSGVNPVVDQLHLLQ